MSFRLHISGIVSEEAAKALAHYLVNIGPILAPRKLTWVHEVPESSNVLSAKAETLAFFIDQEGLHHGETD